MSAYDVEAAAASELAAASGGDECGSAARAPLFVERSAHRAAVRGAAHASASAHTTATVDGATAVQLTAHHQLANFVGMRYYS